jgi:nucleotidyltransferase AbiEii toxin of type IV toxin-antitoxin system
VSWHDEILHPRQRNALHRLGTAVTERGFYLAGGTAVALHLGHRRSVDLDWFVREPMGDPLALAAELQEIGIPFSTDRAARGTLHGKVHGVRVTFLEYRYPVLEPLLAWAEMPCRLAALRDLACMKLSAIAQRGSKKDFIDLYALLAKGFSLAAMLADYQEKFAVTDLGHVRYALAYLDDAQRERTPRMLWPVTWREMRRAIESTVRDLGAV